MTQAKTDQLAPFACAEIAIQEPALLRLRLFNGRELELDLAPYQFKSAKEAGDFLVEMLSKSMQDVMILANLRPVRAQYSPKPWGCKNAARSQDTHIHHSL